MRALRIQAKRSCRVLVMVGGQGERGREREREGPPLPVIFLDSAPICPSLADPDPACQARPGRDLLSKGVTGQTLLIF